MKRVFEVIVVEGRYDRNAVSQAVECTVIETSGFGVFSDSDKVALLRRLADKRGLVILTDGDKAGFFIRGRLRGLLGDANIKHAYIPDVPGHEKRKSAPSKEGKLGVEGMMPEIIIKALEQAGATFETDPVTGTYAQAEQITKADMYDLGLSGKPDSAKKRRNLLQRLDLPERISANALLNVLNILFTRDDFLALF